MYYLQHQRNERLFRLNLLAAALLIIFFGLITWQTIFVQQVEWFDMPIINFIQGDISAAKTHLMKFITIIGSSSLFAVVCMILGIWMLYRRKIFVAFNLAFCMVGCGIVNQIFKYIFTRPRPDFMVLGHATGFSFPSGHSMGSICFYLFLTLLLTQLFNSTASKIIAYVLAVLIIIAVGISRIYLGVHYPTDVLAGFTIGGAWFFISAAVFFRYKKQ